MARDETDAPMSKVRRRMILRSDCIRIGITSLPDEILLNIFGYLSTYDILRKVSLVCKTFNRITKDPYLIKEVFVSYERRNFQFSKFYEAISSFKGLTKLTIWGSNQELDISVLLHHAFELCPKLCSLAIEYYPYPENPWDLIGSILFGTQCMEDIAKYGNRIKSLFFTDSDIIMNSLSSQIHNFKNLRHLEISESRFSESDLIALTKYCENFECFDNLIMDEFDIENFSEKSMIAFLIKNKTTLKTLRLGGGTFLTANWFQHLSNCELLQDFAIFLGDHENWQMTPSMMMSISKLKNLRSLKFMAVNNLTAEDLVKLFSNQNLKHLEELSLSHATHVNNEVLKTISTECPRLKTLYLTHFDYSRLCHIEFPYLQNLWFTYPQNQSEIHHAWFFCNPKIRNLTNLIIRDCTDITDIVAKIIALNCSKLTYLEFENTYISPKAINFFIDKCHINELTLSESAKYSKKLLSSIKKRVPELYVGDERI